MASRLTSLQVGGATLIALAAGTVGYYSGNVSVTGTLNANVLSGATVVTTSTVTAGGDITTDGNLSGSTLHTLTGITVGDKDGAGCSRIYTLNGVVSSAQTTCP